MLKTFFKISSKQALKPSIIERNQNGQQQLIKGLELPTSNSGMDLKGMETKTSPKDTNKEHK